MSYLLKFGAYTFPRGFYVAEDRVINVVPQQKLGRADGARVIRGSLAQRKIRIAGTLLGPTCPIPNISNMRTELDSIFNALHANAPSVMYVQRDDRYLRSVHCENIPQVMEATGAERIIRMDLDFISGDPFYYSTALQTNTWTVSGTGQANSITPAGVEALKPQFSITVGGAGAVTAAFTILNNTNGQSFTLSGSVTGGNVIVVDCLAETVTISGADRMDLFDGRWAPLIANVANDMREAYTSGTITQIVTTWRQTYL